MDAQTVSTLYGDAPPLGNAGFGALVGIPPPPSADGMKKYRPNCLAQPFNMRARLADADNNPMMGYAALLPCADTVRLLAVAGFDVIMIDWEHSPLNIREVCDYVKIVNTASEGNTAAIVRVPSFDHQHIAWVLDAGASGIIVPHCETVEQVEAVIKAARFPNADGQRSFPPSFTPSFFDGVPTGQTIFDSWNNAAVIIQIESKAACENVDELAKIKGVDGIMIGHADLRLDLGLMPGFDGPEGVYTECVDKVVRAAKDAGLPLVTFTAGRGMVQKRLGQGFRCFILENDGWGLARASRSALADGYEAVDGWKGEDDSQRAEK